MYGKRRSTGQNSTLWLWLALPPPLFNGWGPPEGRGKGQGWVVDAVWCGQGQGRSSSNSCKPDRNAGAREPLGLSTLAWPPATKWPPDARLFVPLCAPAASRSSRACASCA